MVVVGRDAELAEVRTFLDAAGEGFAALVLEGEAGIGKTTVWQEARRRAQERGAHVLWCRPSPAEAKFSFSGVADLLAGVDEGAFAVLPELQRDALAVALLRAAPTGRAPMRVRMVAAGFLSLVRGLASARPLVVAVDDWQWLDRPSRGVLEFAARRLESEPVGMLCSLRSPVAGPLIGGAVSGERLRRVAIGSLSLAALGRIVAVQLGRSLPRPLLVRLARASAGNPFYALEVARLLIERDVELVPGSELPVPADLRALTAARIRRLPAASREALLMAAVLSAPDSATVDVGVLGAAEDAGIVTVDRGGRVDFAHPLFASAVYGSASATHRRGLHRRAAALVSDPEQRARHLALGSERPDRDVAAQLEEAAEHAASRGAPDAAAELAELAAQLTPERDADARGERLLGAARFQFDSGDLARAGVLAQQVLAMSPPDSVRAPALQLAAQLAARRSNFTEAIGLAVGALAASARCSGALATARGEPKLALAAFERALIQHDRTDMPFERARTLLLAGQAHRRHKQWGQARRALSEAHTVFERVGSPLWAARARAELGRIGGPAPAGDELTQTELRVADLAASGLSNQQVAERAYVSVKTVEANLTRIYRKLGVRSRAGLANTLGASERPSQR